MKTKSYKIFSGENEQQTWIEASETPDRLQIILRINGGGVIRLDYEAWRELMGLDYNLKCNVPDQELSQVPRLVSETDEEPEPEHINLPLADETIKKVRMEIEDV